MSAHYPTTAELAAFRRSVAGGSWADNVILASDAIRGAYRDERNHGIGRSTDDGWSSARIAAIARREASAMRSRAYARMARGSAADWHRLAGAIATFEPRGAADWPAL